MNKRSKYIKNKLLYHIIHLGFFLSFIGLLRFNITMPKQQAVMEERSPIQNKNLSSNEEKATCISTKNASTNVNYNDFKNCQGNQIVNSYYNSNKYF